MIHFWGIWMRIVPVLKEVFDLWTNYTSDHFIESANTTLSELLISELDWSSSQLLSTTMYDFVSHME